MSIKEKEKALLEQPVSAGTQAALSAPTYTPSTYKPSASVTAAQEALNKHSEQSPGQYKSKWQAQLDDTVDKILNREEFSYDVNGDALYKQYADKFTRQGKTAMEDTIARASAMTGGYGNSYAQTAGQAAYATEMQKLGDVIPELYQLALDKYTREGDTLRDNYAMLTDADATDYGRHRDMVGDWRDERSYLAQRADTEYARDYGEWSDAENRRFDKWRADTEDAQYAEQFEYTKDRDAVEDGRYDTEWQYKLDRDAVEDGRYESEHANDAYYALAARILNGGYNPSDAELAAAGMSREEANAYIDEHNRAVEGEELDNTYTRTRIDNINAGINSDADDDDGGAPDEKDLYGGYTRAEFNTLMSDYVDEPDAAARYVRAAGTDEARAAFRAFFGDEVYGEYFGGYAEETVTELESLLMTPEEFIHSGGREEYGDYLSYIDETAMRWRNEGKFKTDDEMIAFIQAMEEKM